MPGIPGGIPGTPAIGAGWPGTQPWARAGPAPQPWARAGPARQPWAPAVLALELVGLEEHRAGPGDSLLDQVGSRVDRADNLQEALRDSWDSCFLLPRWASERPGKSTGSEGAGQVWPREYSWTNPSGLNDRGSIVRLSRNRPAAPTVGQDVEIGSRWHENHQ